MEKQQTLKEQIQEDESVDYQCKDWERFKEQQFLQEYKDKGEDEYGK